MQKKLRITIVYGFLLLCLFFQLKTYADELPEPYNSINLLPFDSHGFFNPANEAKLKEILTTRNIKTIIEVGSWLGTSIRFMASLLPADGKAYAIDHWLGSNEHRVPGSSSCDKLKTLYRQFLSNTVHAQLAHKIIPIRMYSLEAADALNITADLIYIDASHEEESVYNDIMGWYPKLKPDGIMCGDDYGGNAPEFAIKKAVHRAALQLNKTVKVAGGWFWWFE